MMILTELNSGRQIYKMEDYSHAYLKKFIKNINSKYCGFLREEPANNSSYKL